MKSKYTKVLKQNTYMDSNRLFHFVIRVSKENAYFFYFILESLEGVCFYSTLPTPNGPMRLIDIKGPIEFQQDLESILETLTPKFSLKILSKSEIIDSISSL